MNRFLTGIRRKIAILKATAVGERADPAAVIGPCQFCDQPVRYAEGDTDGSGHARHDTCLHDAWNARIAPMVAETILQRAIVILRDIPAVTPRLREAFDALPDDYGPAEMAQLIAAMQPHVEAAPSLTRGTRAKTLLALRGLKCELLGLPHARAA